MSTQHDPGSQRKPFRSRPTSQASCSQLHFYQGKCHRQSRQTILAIIAIKTIELVSQPNWLAETSVLVHPSREVRYDCSKPKRECLHSSCLHTKSSQSDNNFRVLTCLRVQCAFSASVPGFTTDCNNPSNVSHTWPACNTAKLFRFRSMKTNSQQSFLFRFKYSSKQFPLPTQFRSFPMTHYMSQSNALTTAVQTTS